MKISIGLVIFSRNSWRVASAESSIWKGEATEMVGKDLRRSKRKWKGWNGIFKDEKGAGIEGMAVIVMD